MQPSPVLRSVIEIGSVNGITPITGLEVQALHISRIELTMPAIRALAYGKVLSHLVEGAELSDRDGRWKLLWYGENFYASIGLPIVENLILIPQGSQPLNITDFVRAALAQRGTDGT